MKMITPSSSELPVPVDKQLRTNHNLYTFPGIFSHGKETKKFETIQVAKFKHK